ncbi:MAG: Gfo/Idh/MocA family oxidoreductase [Spirochaetota bacterium]
MENLIRIGLTGCGFISTYHYDCLKRIYGLNIEVTGVFDNNIEKARMFASERGIHPFKSLEDLLANVDVVTVGTPPATHESIILAAATMGKDIICEKPLIGYAPPAEEKNFVGITAPKELMRKSVYGSLARIENAIKKNSVNFCYFENLIYSPSLQKEREIIEKTGAQILRMLGEESHRGNHATYSSNWKYACGGSLISTGSHPIGALLYLKRVEGHASGKGIIKPLSVSARIQQLTKLNSYKDKGFLRSDYYDVEDYAWVHIDFEDGTVGDVVTGATVLGGLYDYVEVFANNHRSRCRMNPINSLDVYNPEIPEFDKVYLEYGLSTNKGWSHAVTDEYWVMGYQQEMQDALESFVQKRRPVSDIAE